MPKGFELRELGPTLTDEAAENLAAYLGRIAREKYPPMYIVVLGANGAVLAMKKTGNVKSQSFPNACLKALTALNWEVNDTGSILEWPEEKRRSAERMDPEFVAAGGGLRLVLPESGAVIGAIGISGGTQEEDRDLARCWVNMTNGDLPG